MRPDAPQPTKREILPPITPEHLDHFVHPGGVAHFHTPFLPPTTDQSTDPHTYAANGYLCLRTTAHIPDLQEHPGAYQRTQSLPWSRFDTLAENTTHWRTLEHARPALFKFPHKPIWERTRTRFHLRTTPIVRIGLSALAPLPLIQLLSRLPRAEIFLPSDARTHLLIRFRYGQAILAPFNQIRPDDYHSAKVNLTIFRSRDAFGPTLRGGLA